MSVKKWEKIGEPEILAKGFGKSFSKQQFRDHQGKTEDFFFFDQPSWSVVLPITEAGNVLVIRQFKQGAEMVMEELPGGTADFAKEPPEKVMRRELLEETGYEPGEVTFLGTEWMNSRNSHTICYYFLARDCKKIASPKLDRHEEIEIVERPLRDWIEQVFKRETGGWDACALAAKALPYLDISLKFPDQ